MRDIVLLAYPGAEIREAKSIAAAREALQDFLNVDLVLLDLSMEDTRGFDGLMLLRKRFASLPLLVISALDEPRIIDEVMRLGAAGFVSKSAGKAALTDAIGRALNGHLVFPSSPRQPAVGERSSKAQQDLLTRIGQLTPQQLRVLSMIRQGKLNKQIAHELDVGDSTVKAHVSAILRKLGVISRTQIVIETSTLSFISPN